MTVELIVGLCAIAVVYRLFTGDAGRIALLAAVVVGWGVGIARTLADQGTGLLAGLGDAIAQLGGAL
jgi:hypothetical protein